MEEGNPFKVMVIQYGIQIMSLHLPPSLSEVLEHLKCKMFVPLLSRHRSLQGAELLKCYLLMFHLLVV